MTKRNAKKNIMKSVDTLLAGVYRSNKSVLITNSPLEQFGSMAFIKQHEKEFMGYFPKIVKCLTERESSCETEDALRKLYNLLEYTIPTGEKVKGITTVVSCKKLTKSDILAQEYTGSANILGWCAELLEAADVVAEDIINNSEIRGNGPCWFRLTGVGNTASLDLFTLQYCIYYLLKTNFSQHHFYRPMIEFFHDMVYRTSAGRVLDSQKLKTDHWDTDMFRRITEYKSGYDDFYVGVTLGMYLSEIYVNELHKQVTPVLMDMGRYFRIQNDMRDYFNESAGSGNLTKDIKEGRCTWLAALALKKADPSQRQIIKDTYGKPEDGAVQAITNVYKNLDIPAEFQEYERDSFKSLCANIDGIANTPMRDLLHSLVVELYNR